jgi:ketosteroid isomerase-like protein
MPQENVEIVRRVYTEFGLSRDGIEAATRLGLIARDAEFDYSELYFDGRVVRGVEAWSAYMDSFPWGRSLKLTPERFLNIDQERVLVFVHASAEGEGSGAPVERRSASEITVRDGAIVRVKLYLDQTDALEAAGLSE